MSSLADGRTGPRAMNSRKLALFLNGCSVWESGHCTSLGITVELTFLCGGAWESWPKAVCNLSAVPWYEQGRDALSTPCPLSPKAEERAGRVMRAGKLALFFMVYCNTGVGPQHSGGGPCTSSEQHSRVGPAGADSGDQPRENESRRASFALCWLWH